MKTDTYTKVVLTIIAACLIWQCIDRSNVMPVAQTLEEPNRIYLSGWVDESGVVKRLPSTPNSAIPVTDMIPPK
jgi:hypothetical protein